MGCEICAEDHAVETCSIIGHCTPVDDTPTISYARLSLPAGLEVKDLVDGNKTVVTTKKFFRGVMFGPFKATTTSTLVPTVAFPLKIFLKNGDEVFLKTDEEYYSNWMCFVAVATCKEEVNMYCYQVNESIYYSVIVDLLPGTELRVWYAPHYSELLKADPLPSDICQMEPDTYEIDTEPIGDHQYVNKKKKKDKKRQTSKLNKQNKKMKIDNEYGLSEEKKRKLPAQVLGAVQPRNEWKCVMCKVVEPSLSQYASHLINHLKLKCRRQCKYCRSKMNGKHERSCKIHLYLKGMSDGSDLTEEDKNCIKKHGVKSVNNNLLSDITNDLKTDKANESVPQNKDVKSVDDTNKQSDLLLNCDKDNDFNCQLEITSSKNVLMDFFGNGMWNADNNSMDNVINSNVVSLDSNSSLKERQLDLPPPILDLSDELEFQSLKNFTDIDKQFSRNSDFFDNVSVNLLNSVDGINPTDQFSLFPLDKSEFLEQKFENLLEVTDEEKNRLVENLLNETEQRMSDSVFEVDNGLKEGEALVIQQEKERESEESSKQESKKEKERTQLFSCDICKKKFTKLIYLIRHLKKHTGEFSCKYCMNIFARKETLLSHRCLSNSTLKSDYRKERCGICLSTFFSHQELLLHVGQHYCTDSKWKCTHCYLIADNSQDIDKHVCAQSSGQERQVSCSNCNKLFSTNNEFVEHREDINVEKLKVKKDDKIICEICGVCTKKKMLKKHQMRCQRKGFDCLKCGDKLQTEQDLQSHEKNHLPPSKYYSCYICQKSLKQLKNLNRHILLHSESNKIACEYCDKKFNYKQNYQQHLERHLKPPKDLKCDDCQVSFSCKHQREKHLAACSKTSFDCSRCKKYNKEALKRLLEDIEYTCCYCKSVFQYRQSLMRHLNQRHANLKEEWQVKSVIEAMKVYIPKKIVSETNQMQGEILLQGQNQIDEALPDSEMLLDPGAVLELVSNADNVSDRCKQALLQSEIVSNGDLITLNEVKLMEYVDTPQVPVVLSKNELLEMVNRGSLEVTNGNSFASMTHDRLQDLVNSVSPISVTNQDRLLDLVNDSCNVSVSKDLILSKGGILELVGSTVPAQGEELAGFEHGVTVNVLWTNVDNEQDVVIQPVNPKPECIITPAEHVAVSEDILGLNIDNNFNSSLGTYILEDERVMNEDVQLGGDILLYVVEQPTDEQELQFV